MATMENPLVFAVGILGNILSFLVILAPVPTFYRVYKKKSTESFQSVPYVMALLSAMLWLYYALLTRDILLLSINAIGCLVESLYLAIYLLYAPKQAMGFTVKLLSTMNVGLYGAMVAFLQLYIKGERRVSIAGGIGASFALAVFVAPLTIIRQVIRTKSVEFMPFWLSFFLTISAVVWFFYGLLMKDFFVAMPNVLGLVFGLAQMALHLIYKNPKKSGAVISEIQVVDVDKDQIMQAEHVAATIDADGEVVGSVDAGKSDDVEITPPPLHHEEMPAPTPPHREEMVPRPHYEEMAPPPPPRLPICLRTAVEVV